MDNKILNISNKVKKARDNNPILDALAGFIPGVGEVQDVQDFAYSAKNKDYLGMAMSLAGIATPFVSGATLRSGAKAVQGILENVLDGFDSKIVRNLLDSGITENAIKKLSDLGYSYSRKHDKLGHLLKSPEGKEIPINFLQKKFPDIFGEVDYGYDLKKVQRTLDEYINRTGKLATDYPGFARQLDRGFPEAIQTMERAQKIVKGEGVPTIHGGQPDALSVARAQGQSGEFGLGYHGDAPFVGNKRKYSKSFGGYFFLTQGERAKQAAMAYSHFESPELVLQLSTEAGLPLEVAQRAQKLSERIHQINKELGIKEYTLAGELRAPKKRGQVVKFQYENTGLLKEKTRDGESVEKLLNEYAQIGEELTNLFKYTPTGQKIGQVKQYLYKHNSPINTEAIVSGFGSYNDIIDPKYIKRSGTLERNIRINPEDGKHNISTAETFFGNQGVDKITIQGIANPIPGVTTLGVNPKSTTLIYKKGNKLCRR